MARLYEKYKQEVIPNLKKELGRQNLLTIPRLRKIVVSMGVGDAVTDKKRMDKATEVLRIVAGQKPIVCKAKRSVSNFKLRKGYDVGCKVTLRGVRMYEFLDRLISVVIPRVRDFRGLDPQAFDGHGNYSMGLSEQSVFPEIDLDKIETPQGMNITMVTSSGNDSDGKELLKQLGMPFRN